ncbi:hypothetical protein C0993_004887 [Termitomyces sp. T159_Od127]|nr:hypothetical protein C0993_004887 [Termitomyces sp. T159_Od127]
MATAAYSTLLTIAGRQLGHVQLVHLPPCAPPVPIGPPLTPPRKPPPPPTKHPVSIIAAHETALTTLSVPASGRLLATTSSRGTLVRIWDSQSGKLVRELRRGTDKADIYGVAFRPDEQELCVWSDKGTTVIEPSSFTEEKYALFQNYQMNVHNESSTPSDFKRFLVESPLLEESIIYAPGAPSHLPRNYGSYHQLYRLNGKLIALDVIDILPHCISSVYFMYDDTWQRFSLGKTSSYWDDEEVRDSIMAYLNDIGVDTAKEILRRQIRERRQYIYAKSQEAQERQTYERKQQLKDALASGKSLPTELRRDAKNLAKDLAFDSAQEEPTTHIDDEYSRAGIQDPKIVITTSRDPSSKLLQFTKEMRLVFPNSHRINRGNYVVKELAEACRANDVTDLIILHEHRGVPDAMIVSHFPHGPTVFFTLSNVSLRHDIGTYQDSTVSEQYPHLIFENFTSSLGQRVRDVLKYLFPVPKEDSKRVMTFANEDDFISFRHHVFMKIPRQVQLAEVGPRFEMKPYEIRQGTLEQTEAEREWVLAHYARTTKKRAVLGGPVPSSEPPTKRLR